MVREVSGTVLIVLGMVAAASGPAAAGPKTCALGTWTLAKQHGFETGTVDGKSYVSTVKGGLRTRLTLGKAKATFDFAKTTKIRETMAGGNGLISEETYTRTLKIGTKLTGKAKGTLLLRYPTASGTATRTHIDIQPLEGQTGGNLATDLKKGGWSSLVPPKASFTCTKKTLTLTAASKGKNPDGERWRYRETFTYKRR